MQHEARRRLAGVGQKTDRRGGQVDSNRRLDAEQGEQSTSVADWLDKPVGTCEHPLQVRKRLSIFVPEPRHGTEQTRHEQVADQTVT